MLIRDFMPIVRNYYIAGPYCIYDRPVSPTPSLHSETGLYKAWDNDNRMGFVIDESADMDRGSYSHYVNHYRHEGATVYYTMDDRIFRERCSLDYEILYVNDDRLSSKRYGLIINYEGQWRLYLADSHMFVMDNVDFKTAAEAKEYFDTCIKNDPFIQEIIDNYSMDMD